MKYILIYLLSFFLVLACKGENGFPSEKEKFEDYKAISKIILDGINQVLHDNIKPGHDSFEKALSIAKQKHYDELIPVIIISQSRLFALEDRHQEGLDALLSIQQYFIDQPDRPYAGDYYEYIGHTYLKMGKLQEALEALQKTEAIRKAKEPGKNWRTYNGMAEIYSRLGIQEKAAEYKQKSNKLSKMQNSKKMLDDIRNDLAFNEKDGTIAILSSENITTKTALQQSQNRNLIYGIGIAALAIISVFLYIVLVQRNRLNKEIILRNKIISSNLEEKEHLIKEIHHRVKNNLQVISSLLSLQSRTVNDQSAVDALHESQSRVLSMSLIHQNLYKDNLNSQIDLKSYLTNLCQNLFATYNIRKDQIDLILDIDDMKIDVGSMVPLGLIVNELITNSLKYAFSNSEHGKIGISCRQEGNSLVLKVWDDGIGQTPIENGEGFGYRLIQTFAKRLNAKISRTVDNGTCIELVVDNIKKAI